MSDSTGDSTKIEGNPGEAGGGSPDPGLVICAITSLSDPAGSKNPGISGIPATVPEGLIGYRWPSPEMVDTALGAFSRTLPAWDGSEGPRARIEVGPGIVRVARRDLNRAEKTRERLADKHASRKAVVDEPAEGPVRGTVFEWSARSRSRMVSTIASLDLRHFRMSDEGIPAMVTLTLPGDWLAIAPTAAEYSRLVGVLVKRFEKEWQRQLVGLWKREFQRRGAPHTHLFMVVPNGRLVATGESFRDWLSRSWMEVCDPRDPKDRANHLMAGTGIDVAEGLRSTDPRRIAVYFSKHSSANFGDKEYQHIVPAEWAGQCGRFWGYWHLQKATSYVEVPMGDSITAARIMRRWARAQGTTRQTNVWRLTESTGTYRKRRVRRRVHRLGGSAGFLCVNDGPSFAWQLARALDVMGGGES